MWRCIQLAKMGAGYVSPNPMVGAVLVYNNRIIGEGFHAQYGQAHAEVNCLRNVADVDIHRICKSILYVSLEPCSHFGKTPPCVDLILENNIPQVVIGCRDPFEKVNGTGINKLLDAGVKVETDILREECINLNKRFFTFHKIKRPYIILKWAQSNDGFIDGDEEQPLKISNKFTHKLSHKWRSEEAGILVGTQTVLKDNPRLDNRNWYGKNPVRIIIDRYLRINIDSQVYNDKTSTIIINILKSENNGNLFFHKIEDDENVVGSILKCLYDNAVISCIIEGGSKTLQSFINADLWDEARVITNTSLNIEKGREAPLLSNALLRNTDEFFNDRISFFINQNNDPL